MKLFPTTTVHDLLDSYPFLLDFLANYNPKFSILRNRTMRATMGRMATLSKVASMGDIRLNILLTDISKEIEKHTGEIIETELSNSIKDNREALDTLKGIIMDLHKGVEFSEVKNRFDTLMGEIDPSQITDMEEQLIREGMPAEEIQRLCDLHVSVFRDALEKKEPVEAPSGHPVHTYMAENTVFTGIVTTVDTLIGELSKNPTQGNFQGLKNDIEGVIRKLSEIEKHYQRKEYQLFPFLEKHGITGPSQVMWGIHDEVRALFKDIGKAIEEGKVEIITEKAPRLSRTIIEMIYKENTILFPMAMETLTEEEWKELRSGEDEVGYAFVLPGSEWPDKTAAVTGTEGQKSTEYLHLDTGELSPGQINLMLTHLPVEVSFVDENDEVRYYSDTKDRIFPRSPGIIGRKVQNCHPPKSIHIVNHILDAFRSGVKDYADFWINMNGKVIYISYYAVRDRQGAYRGTIEVTQDITRISRLTGERRLLDWNEQVHNGKSTDKTGA